MKNTDPEFIRQLQLLKPIEDLIEQVSIKVNALGEAKPPSMEISDVMDSTRTAFVRRSLVRFLDICKFLRSKLEVEDEEVFMHYLPNLRCLFDIYARISFVVDNSLEKTSLIIVAERLKKPANVIKTSKNNIDDLTVAYLDEVEFFREMFFSQNIELPNDPVKLSKDFLKDNKLNFPNIETMLNSKSTKRLSSKTQNVWKTIAENPYSFYRHFSSYSHGDEMNEAHGNEILWIASNVQILGIMIVEAVDSKILGNQYEKEIDIVLADASHFSKFWVQYWQRRKKTK